MVLEVTDEVVIRASRSRVFDGFWNARIWPRITPHVTRIEMLDEGPAFQRFRMGVRSGDREFSVVTERTAVPGESIEYHQTEPPALFREHGGVWRFEETHAGMRVALTHRALLDEERAPEILGVASLEEARERVRAALSRNGRLTMEAVKRLVEDGDDANGSG